MRRDLRSFNLWRAGVLSLLFYCFQLAAAATPIAYVQGNSATPQSPQTSVKVTFTKAQAVGDLNIVVVGWNDTTAAVKSVADTSGNTYALAVGPTLVSGSLSQSVYYAKNIAAAAAGANAVTVTFSVAAAYPDIRVLEYSGADPNLPVDVTAAGSGNSATSTSATANTSNPTDLIFGANIVATTTNGAGSGFTKRLLTSPDGDLAEDKMVTATGAYSTTAPLSSSGAWIMQMVAFRTPSAPQAPPALSSLSCSNGSMTGAGTDACTVALTAAAPSGGFSVNLASNNSAVTLPASLTVAAGSSSASFTATVSAVTSAQTTTLTATAGGVSESFALQLNAAVPTLSLSASSLAFGSVAVNTPTTQTVTLTSAGTAAVTVSAATVTGAGFSTSGVTFPLTLSPGQTAALKVQFDPTAAGTVTGQLTFTSNSSTGGASVIGLSGSGVAMLTALTCTSASMTGAGNDACTVALNAAASSGGVTITLASDNSAVSVPASVTVASGSTSASFTANVAAVTATQTATLTAIEESDPQTFALQLNAAAPTVSSVSPKSGPTAGGTAVTITGTNFAAGATVTFGGTAATNVVVENSTTLTATTPSGSAGAVTVGVTNSGTLSGSLANGFTYAAATAIAYVQGNYATPQSPQASVAVTFTNAQTAGDLNVVVVGWNDTTAVVQSVTDTSGNTYTLGVGPTVVSDCGCLSQSIYYAKNIAAAGAGANAVTVTFSVAAAYPDIRVLEYSGADLNSPVDITATGSGNSGASTSATANTSNPSDLIFGANTVTPTTIEAGSGFTERLLTSPDGDIAEDNMVTATGAYSATAPLSSSGEWVMQMVAFRTPSAPQAPPALSALSCSNGSMTGAGTDACTVALTAAAPSGGFTATVSAVTTTQTATLTASAGGVTETDTISLGAAAPALALNATSVSFGDVNLNTPATQSVILTSSGTAALTVSAGSVTGAGFSISGVSFPVTLNPGKTATLNIQFDPTTAGAATGAVTLTSDASPSIGTIALSGTGVAGSYQVDLTWNAPTSSTDPVAGYNIYRATGNSSTYQLLNATADTSTTYTDSTVQNATSYTYYVESVDSEGNQSGPSNTYSVNIP
jgi:hypothetical protein